MSRYKVTTDKELTLSAKEPLLSMYVLSPYVWRENGKYLIALRAVNRSVNAQEKVARIYFGTSDDGLCFEMADEPSLTAGVQGADDDGGCEDPTVLQFAGRYYVFYTGWNREEERARLQLASGEDLHKLQKHGRVFPENADYRNTKEATTVKNGERWLMFYEYSHDRRSLIGMAESQRVEGPWSVVPSICETGRNAWDNYHLSTGPIVLAQEDLPVMFYNGANDKAHWRIGWMEFSPDYSRIVRRSTAPLISPPAVSGDDTDVAFSASAVEIGDEIRLYYSVSDERLRVATVSR